MKASRFSVALVFTFVLAGTAYAQPAEQPAGDDKPAHGFAPPSDEIPPDSNALPGVNTSEAPPEGTHHAGAHHHDPTQTFNFAGDWFSFYGKDITGGKLGDGRNYNPETGQTVPGAEEAMSPPFVFMVLNFLLLLALLVWKGRPAVQQIAAERHDQIKTALDEAAKLRQQAADKLAEYEARLKDADAEIKTMVEGMKKDAETDKARILEAAERQSAQMKRDAEARIAAEIEMVRAQLTREVTSAAAVATEKILREKMGSADQAALVSSFISNVQERA
jgi:F-type H+-transporting ATPase subunit b